MSTHIHVHALAGCTPTPLAAYLKALAVTRLVAGQRDPSLRAWWQDDTYFIATELDIDAVLGFFLHDYRPTPLIAPWNGGSGFYPKDNKSGLDMIAGGSAARFGDYRRIIQIGRELTQGTGEAPKKDGKTALIRSLRNRIRGPGAEWLDAALVLAGDGVRYPALLGTGGNDGRLDFTNNQMQRLCELISPDSGEPLPRAAPLLRASLLSTATSGLMQGKPIGQFFPGAAGGANSTNGYSGESLINPWDFILMLEGAVLLQVAAVRRLDAGELPQAAAPFAVRSQAAGYASATGADESARGEQWMPMWTAPASLAEIRALFAEGRLQSGEKRAGRAIDAAKAVARLGTARGVGELVRFGFIERNGQANLAVPLGRWQVRRDPHVHLLDDIDPWVDRLRHKAGGKGAPASMERDLRRIERAMLDTCRDGQRPETWLELLAELGRAEDNLVARGKSTAAMNLRPLPLLSPAWLAAADDGSPELRLAAALASQYADKRTALGSIRAHCVPLDQTGRRFATTGEGLLRDRGVVWTGANLITDLGAMTLRRLLDSRRAGTGGFELRGRLFAPLADIDRFLAGDIDEARIAAVARALMAVRWGDRGEHRFRDPAGHSHSSPSAAYALFRLLYLPADPSSRGDRPGAVLDPTPLRLLMAGRLQAAAQLALRRATVTLGRPRIHFLRGSAHDARRLAASLCLPVGKRDLERLHAAVLRPDNSSHDSESADLSERSAQPTHE